MRVLLIVLALAIVGCGPAPKKALIQRPPPKPLTADAYAHYLRGQLAFFEGDFKRAVPELRKARKAAPSEAPIAVALVSALYESGARTEALLEIQGAKKRWPNSAQVWMKSGALNRGVGNHKQAVFSYRRALALGARTQALSLAYAAELTATNKSKSAQREYRKLIAAAPGNAEAHYRLARLLDQDENHRSAAKHAAKAVELAPYDLRAWALLSMELRKLGDTAKSHEALRRPFDRSGGDGRVSEQLFTELLDLGPKAHAHELVAILDRDDLRIDTRIGMGHLYLRLGNFAQALKVAAKVDGKLASTAAVAELRARALRALGQNGEAAKQLWAIGEKQPGFALTRAMLAELLADQGKFDQARELLDYASSVRDDDAGLVLARSSVEEKAGNFIGAKQILQEAIERHPRAQRPRYALAELESRHGHVQEAIATIEPLIKANPRDSSALNYVGYTLIRIEGARKRARSLLLRALELAPDSAFIQDSYGWLLFQEGDLKAATPFLERAARLTPAEPEVVLHLAELRWRTGAQKDALALLRRAEKLALESRLKERIRSRLRTLSAST